MLSQQSYLREQRTFATKATRLALTSGQSTHYSLRRMITERRVLKDPLSAEAMAFVQSKASLYISLSRCWTVDPPASAR